jgi:carbonic anhydrase/acetyltransferase-like protein (isoleucine patch superfamily)
MLIPYQGKRPRVHPTAFVEESARVIGDVEMGENSSVWFHAVLRGDTEPIRVGPNSNIQDGCIVHTSRGLSGTVLEEQVSVGHSAILHGCRVRKNCLIGMGAILMDRVEVGEGSIVAAGAVLTAGTKVPPRSIVAGVPGRVVKEVNEDHFRQITANWKEYVHRMREYRG